MGPDHDLDTRIYLHTFDRPIKTCFGTKTIIMTSHIFFHSGRENVIENRQSAIYSWCFWRQNDCARFDVSVRVRGVTVITVKFHSVIERSNYRWHDISGLTCSIKHMLRIELHIWLRPCCRNLFHSADFIMEKYYWSWCFGSNIFLQKMRWQH